jgi:hypothetical protein
MDMKEASAMTEASGLTDGQRGKQDTIDPRWRPLQSALLEAAARWAERLRKVTVKAPRCGRSSWRFY